ncbi:MAG: hypothetical protein ACOX6V_02355 [Patescibacteria group bacterium]|jgi:hypothetical protein
MDFDSLSTTSSSSTFSSDTKTTSTTPSSPTPLSKPKGGDEELKGNISTTRHEPKESEEKPIEIDIPPEDLKALEETDDLLKPQSLALAPEPKGVGPVLVQPKIDSSVTDSEIEERVDKVTSKKSDKPPQLPTKSDNILASADQGNDFEETLPPVFPAPEPPVSEKSPGMDNRDMVVPPPIVNTESDPSTINKSESTFPSTIHTKGSASTSGSDKDPSNEQKKVKKGGNVAKLLLILGPLFLIVSLVISFLIINSKLPTQLEALPVLK